MELSAETQVVGSLRSLIPGISQVIARQVAIAAGEVKDLAIEGATGGNKKTVATRQVDDYHWRVEAIGIVPTVQEFGSVEHIIAPKNYPEGVLSWIGKDGVRRFAKFVIHPGTQPRPFMRPAADAYRRTFQEEMARALQVELQEGR